MRATSLGSVAPKVGGWGSVERRDQGWCKVKEQV